VGLIGAAWIVKLAFIGLLIAGVVSGALRAKGLAVFLALGTLAWLGLPFVPRGADFVTSALALVDVALVFVVCRGDVRIT
jgi:hypothetical protein